jgi:L-threonylcarbamoyladenylate synthase
LPSVLTGGTGKIGIRVPGHPVAAALVRAVGGPVTGTSANISGHPGTARTADFAPELARGLDFILDAGILRGGPGSTVVDVTVSPPQIIRVGEISAGEIQAVLENS